MQSISKIISLMVALEECGEEKVFSKVGKEPTGDPFNSIVRLETYRIRKPLNPMINAGAIAISSLIPGADLDERQQKLLSFVREVTGNSQVFANLAVCNSENATGFRNRSLAWFLKDLGVIDSDVEVALSLYFWQCSMSISVLDLARIAAFLANDGIVPHSGKRLISVRTAKIVKGLMFTCGLYDGSGEFGVEAGIPAKSGVGGGILAASPGRLGLGVFGPALDERGNSVAGIHMLGALARELELSVL
jgi:glutaminase